MNERDKKIRDMHSMRAHGFDRVADAMEKEIMSDQRQSDYEKDNFFPSVWPNPFNRTRTL